MGWEHSDDIDQKLVGLTKEDKEIVNKHRNGESFSGALRRIIQSYDSLKSTEEKLDNIEKRIERIEVALDEEGD